MPEGGRTSYEHEIEEKLKKLDAKINVPEIPDAQAIFERAEKKKNNIFSKLPNRVLKTFTKTWPSPSNSPPTMPAPA